MIKESSKIDWIHLEKEVLDFWDKNDCFDKLVKKNENKPRFRFLDGPVTANNRLGVHHIWGRTLKDIAIKYNSMIGKSCQFQNGFDAQGMWVEVNVEKELGLNGKPEILKYGMDKFTNKCMERVNYFANAITEQSKRMGQWMDWENSYFTNTDENITSIWAFLKKCDEKGWIIKKNRPMAWCPRCGTSLSEHEMGGAYHDVECVAMFIKLPVIGKDFKMVAWTTTPWTLSANVALAVNPEFTYAKVKQLSTGETLVMGKDALNRVLKDDYNILSEFKGTDLVGLTYETCFPELKEQNFTHKIVSWDEVDSVEGSCVVHIAPGCGQEDFELGKVNNLKEICPINDQGVMLDDTGFLAGKKTTDVIYLVENRLSKDNKLLYAHKYKHSYPFCWRCKTDLVYKLISTWYISMDELRPQLLKAIDEVEFKPEYAKKRMADWLNNMGDWNISRSRFYGLPLPIYVCPKCGKVHIIGSLDELKQKATNPELIDKLPSIHRPWIDDITIKCDNCSTIVSRVPEVGDCWLDAGITPFSTKKYFTDKEYFKNNFPNEYVCEMIEQIKLWFYSLLVMSVVLTGHAPYEKIVTYQYVKDENGEEFHKSGGNSLDCEDVANKVGADAIRYLYAGANPNNEMRFGYSLIDEARRKMLGFWNTYTFFNTYAYIDKPDIANYNVDDKNLDVTDKWLLQITNKFIHDSRINYENYENYLIVKDFEKLSDDISNFYIRTNRRRFWKSENATDKLTAYWCLYHCLKAIIQVMSPIIPFMCEHIWHNMVLGVEHNESESILLSDMPKSVYDVDYSEYLEYAEIARNLITLASRLRNENQLKVKQPLSKAFVISHNPHTLNSVNQYKDLIKDELNIRDIVVTDSVEDFNSYYLTVNFKTAGAVLKGDVQKLKATLENADATTTKKYVEEYNLGKVEVLPWGKLDSSLFLKNSKPKADYIQAQDGDLIVVLDIKLTPELINEGLLREIIRNAQVLRKEADFNIEDRVYMSLTSNNDTLLKIINDNSDKIKQEVLAIHFNTQFTPDIEKDVEVGEGVVNIKLKAIK